MREIPLSQGKVALVDDADFDFLNQWKWSLNACAKKHTTRLYAKRALKRSEENPGKSLPMHRAILGAKDGEYVDHIDGNGLNNQRSNLRICSNADNMLNCRSHADGSSRFKGVSWDRGRSKWIAHFRGQQIGRFASEKDAAAAYDKAASEFSPEYCLTNQELEGVG